MGPLQCIDHIACELRCRIHKDIPVVPLEIREQQQAVQTRVVNSEPRWTKQLGIYDLRTNMDFTLKTNPLARGNLDEFVECFHADNRFERTPIWSPSNELGRWRNFLYEELMARDKVNHDIFWLRDESLEDSANLPDPDVLAAEIVEDLRSALAQFESIEDELSED